MNKQLLIFAAMVLGSFIVHLAIYQLQAQKIQTPISPKCFADDEGISDRKLMKAILLGRPLNDDMPQLNNLAWLEARLCEDPTYLDD